MGLRTMPWDEWFEVSYSVSCRISNDPCILISDHRQRMLQLDDQFVNYHRIREHRLRTRGERLVQVLPATPGLVNGGHDAGQYYIHCIGLFSLIDSETHAVFFCNSLAAELVQEMAEYLSRRYPTTYTVKRHESDADSSGWYGLPSIKEITIVPVSKSYIIEEEEPMALAGMLYVCSPFSDDCGAFDQWDALCSAPRTTLRL